MTEPLLAASVRSGRAQLAVKMLLFGVIFLLTNQLVDRRASQPVIAAAAIVSGIIAGVIPAFGSRHRRLSRWLLLIQFASLAVVLGLLTRMIVQGFRHLG